MVMKDSRRNRAQAMYKFVVRYVHGEAELTYTTRARSESHAQHKCRRTRGISAEQITGTRRVS